MCEMALTSEGAPSGETLREESGVWMVAGDERDSRLASWVMGFSSSASGTQQATDANLKEKQNTEETRSLQRRVIPVTFGGIPAHAVKNLSKC